jgi:4-hydroxybenzoate polyprenyltransferase
VWWDERTPGGRAHGYFYLLHPGPSLLVTATFVAIAGIAMHAPPTPLRALQLAAAMLCLQFAIGITNDLADRSSDALGKPYKPLSRGAVDARSAANLAVVLMVAGLTAAATINVATLAFFVVGLGAGLAYNFALKRTVVSWLPWWAGVAALPLAAYASAGALSNRLLLILPLTGLVAFGLYLANAAPDIEQDRALRRASVAVALGPERSRQFAVATIGVAAVLAIVFAAPDAQSAWVLRAAGGVLLVALAAVLAFRITRPFPILAITTAIFAIAWLATGL